jgi:hypothetical protein
MESVVRFYADEQGLSFRAAMEFLSTRRSLAVAAQLLGLDKPSCLGEYLDRHGYAVPLCRTHQGKEKKVGLIPPVREVTEAQGSAKPKERAKEEEGEPMESVAVGITREAYLARRRAGETRNAIATSLGFRNSSYLGAAIKQWGLPVTVAAEDALLQTMDVRADEPQDVAVQEAVDEGIGQPNQDRAHCLVLHIPYPDDWKFQICAEASGPLDQTADAALSALMDALVEVVTVTQVLTGREDVSEYVQGFFTRRLDRLLTVH